MHRGCSAEFGALVIRATREEAAEGMCDERGNEGEVESMPEVVNGIRSSASGKCTCAEFLVAYALKCMEQ
jgi:hypothetical protein